MNARPPFDLVHTPIETGTTLIEASAGTGKTFTIAGLFLRLILEQEVSVREILVVTFTEAATEELRGRIRDRLAEAADALSRGVEPADATLAGILSRQRSAGEADRLRVRLDRALGAFDETPIFTLHGFCQRMLKDRAFESRALFDMELMKEDRPLLEEIAADFWRVHCYPEDPIVLPTLLHAKVRPATLIPLLRSHTSHPELLTLSPTEGTTPAERLSRVQASLARLQTIWAASAAEIQRTFAIPPDATKPEPLAWATKEHAKAPIVAENWRQMAVFLDDARRTTESIKAVEFFAAPEIAHCTRKRHSPPSHPFFEECQAFLDACRLHRIGFQLEFIEFARRELPRRKRERKVQTFDDLLHGLKDALRASGGDRLAAEIRSRYRVAMIDEFQDTDPVQCEIFQTLFQRDDRTLFLIGDPKQAIYGFRGADIFTYLDAARGAHRSYTLDRNFRSESGLVQAVNSVFLRSSRAFLDPGIRFQPVAAAGRADAAPLTEESGPAAPLQIWFMDGAGGGPKFNQDRAENEIARRVVAEIRRLLTTPCRLGQTPVGPRDIAVLVPKNAQARLMQDTLRASHIPSVLYTEESVFASREAAELQHVLGALAAPGRDAAVRAALATELMGLDAVAIDELTRDEAAFQVWQERWAGWHEIGQANGFTPMFRRWLQDAGVRPRLLAFDDGERRLTNVLHLGEVLHQAALERRLGLAGLARWLAEQIESEQRDAEEHQLRLERDDHAVRLVTIHKSKGLEYPIVFCPFSWRPAESSRNPPAEAPVYFHRADPDNQGRTVYCCDLGTDDVDQHREIAFAERLAEDLRLAYVALTRARHRCYLVWGSFPPAGTSALAWLLHAADLPANGAPSLPGKLKETLTERWKTVSPAELRQQLEAVAASSAAGAGGPVIAIQDPPDPDSHGPYQPPAHEGTALAPRPFVRTIARDWRILSFSSLAAAHHEARDPVVPEPGAMDRDPASSPATLPAPSDEGEDPSPARGIFAFPRGSNAGTCLHQVFEQLDFGEISAESQLRVIQAQLAAYGLDSPSHRETIREMVRRCLSARLDPAQPEFTLSRVPANERLTELEFFVPVDRLDPAILEPALASLALGDRPAPAGSAPAGSNPAAASADWNEVGWTRQRGYLRGFIDLVFRHDGRFYVLDWKSNHLGNRPESYAPSRLAAEIHRNQYHLQYLIYTVAVHRFLRRRLPGYDYDRHFGGVLYLFVRGIDHAHPGCGIHRDRPAAEWVHALSESLHPATEETP